MTPEIQALQAQVDALQFKLDQFVKADRYQFNRSLAHNGNKLGFFGAVGAVLYSLYYSAATVAGAITSAAGGTWTYNTTTNGGIGTTYYYIPDIVRALKEYGLLQK